MAADPARTDAPAKINLALHVTGQRGDGYHAIETIAVFADIGDRIAAAPAAADSLTITGPEAAALAGEDADKNLVVRARDMLRRILAESGRSAPPVALTLEKHLPAGAGLGGGSADAAAALRALTSLWDCADLADTIGKRAAALGADVPMCLRSTPLVARGVGEILSPLSALPAFPVVLVNPRVHVATPGVFAALRARENPPLPHDTVAPARTVGDWADFLAASTRNDLQAAATSLAPQIGDCLAALGETDALLARMSGSGATCFGIYETADHAGHAASRLLRRHSEWWIKTGMTGPSQAEQA